LFGPLHETASSSAVTAPVAALHVRELEDGSHDAQGDQADRQVDPEDPAPAGTVGEQTAEQRAGHRGQTEDGTEVPHVLAALARRDHVADGGERE